MCAREILNLKEMINHLVQKTNLACTICGLYSCIKKAKMLFNLALVESYS